MPKPVVARLTTPAQMVACLPLYLGYVPTESLVVACLHEPRGRVGLTMRFDLPPAELEGDLVEDVVRRVQRQEPSRLLVAVFTEEPGELPREVFISELLSELDDEVDVTDVLLVRRDRFWSYLCDDPRCCPADGTPVDAAQSDAPIQLLAAEQVLRGQVVQPDREALAASLAGPTFLAAERARQRCGAALEVHDADPEGSLATWAEVVRRFATPPGEFSDTEAAELAVALADRLVRDEVAVRFTPEALLPLLAELCRRTPAPYDAPVCTLYAWMAYCDGAGAEVSICLERALASEPGYQLALLLGELLDSQAPPAVIRRITREAARELPAARRRARRSPRSRGSGS